MECVCDIATVGFRRDGTWLEWGCQVCGLPLAGIDVGVSDEAA